MTIPLWVVTGFLGSGKTSLLSSLARTAGSRRLVFLVNEFSGVEVDRERLLLENAVVRSIAGGSIFCRCLVTEFMGTLRQLSELNPDGVVVEASGMADPRSMRRMLRETRLEDAFDLQSIVCIVDPGSFVKLRHTLPNTVAQVEAADLLLLNKCDLYEEGLLRFTKTELRKLSGNATPILNSRYGVPEEGGVEAVIQGRPTAAPLDAEYAPGRDKRYETACLRFAGEVDREELGRVLAGYGGRLYRAKGRVRTAAGWYQIDYSSSGVKTKPAAEAEESHLVLVFGEGGLDALDRQVFAELGTLM